MKRIFLGLVAITAVVLVSLFIQPAFADTLVSNSGAGWQSSWVTGEDNGTSGTGGIPFFDNTSGDGSDMNIGYYITNTGAFTLPSTPGAGTGPGAYLPYSGTSTGGADTSFYFTNSTGDAVAMKITIAGNAAYNSFGYFLVSGGAEIAGAPSNFSEAAPPLGILHLSLCPRATATAFIWIRVV